MRYLKLFLLVFILSNFQTNAISEQIYIIDMKKLLNESKAGKKAQETLKKKLNDGNKKFEKEGSSLKKEEQDLIAKKKLVSPEEYKKNINDLRKKNIDYQKRRQKAANDIFRQKEKARAELYKALNPILQKYMSENNIKMIIKKNSIVVATTEIDLTDKILKVLDQQLKSINLN